MLLTFSLCMFLILIGGCDNKKRETDREEKKIPTIIEGIKDSSKTALKEYAIEIGGEAYHLCSNPNQIFSDQASIQKIIDKDKEGYPLYTNKVYLHDGSVFTYHLDIYNHIYRMQFKQSDIKTNWKFADSIAFGSSFEDARSLLGEPITGRKLDDNQYTYVFYTSDNQPIEFTYKENQLIEMNIGMSDKKENESNRKTCPVYASEVDLRSDYDLIHMPLEEKDSDFQLLLEKDDILSLHSISDLENKGWNLINEESLVYEKNHTIKLTLDDTAIKSVRFSADASLQIDDMEVQGETVYKILELLGRPDIFQLSSAGENGYFGYSLDNGYIQFELNNKAQITGGEILYDNI